MHQEIQVLAQCRPLDRVPNIGLALERLTLHVGVERPHRPTFAKHFQRDAPANVALGCAILDQRLGCPTQHVDETRRDSQARRIDFDCAVFAIERRGQGRDGVVLDRPVADKRG